VGLLNRQSEIQNRKSKKPAPFAEAPQNASANGLSFDGPDDISAYDIIATDYRDTIELHCEKTHPGGLPGFGGVPAADTRISAF
jgi:hypothetical protein